MLLVPLAAVPAQKLTIVLAGQACALSVYQRRTGLFFDCMLDGAPVCTTVLCQNLARLITQSYSGFKGDFFFYDTQGSEPPDYTGLGARFQLGYLEASDL